MSTYSWNLRHAGIHLLHTFMDIQCEVSQPIEGKPTVSYQIKVMAKIRIKTVISSIKII